MKSIGTVRMLPVTRQEPPPDSRKDRRVEDLSVGLPLSLTHVLQLIDLCATGDVTCENP